MEVDGNGDVDGELADPNAATQNSTTIARGGLCYYCVSVYILNDSHLSYEVRIMHSFSSLMLSMF